MDYLIHLAILLAIQCILALSLDLIFSDLGLCSLCHAVHFGVGAYAAAILMVSQHVPFLPALAAASAAGALSSVLMISLMLRLSGDFFAVGTVALQLLVTALMLNLESLTGGPLGVKSIPQPLIAQYSFRLEFLFVLTGLTAIVWFARSFILSRPLGRVLWALRDSEPWAISLGIRPAAVKILIAAGCGSIAGIAGAIYAVYSTYIDPLSFTLSDSVNLAAMLILGGIGTRWGPIRGAAVLVLLPELLRFVGVSSTATAQLRQAFVGATLIAAAAMYTSDRGHFGAKSLES